MNVSDITLLFSASASPVPTQILLSRNDTGMSFHKNSGQDSVLKRHSKFVKRWLIILR